jgi:N-acyl-D-aspartate/D-glutamate deacylase
MAADVVVFDPATVGPGMPAVQHDLPNGAPRLTQPAEGVDAVVVNGTPLLRDGVHSGALPGRLLRAHRAEVGAAPPP